MQRYLQPDPQGYPGPGKSWGNSGGNPEHEIESANLRFRLAIPPRPCRNRSSDCTAPRTLTPPSQPRRKGSTSGVGKNNSQETAGAGLHPIIQSPITV